jgi:hypothetical protein
VAELPGGLRGNDEVTVRHQLPAKERQDGSGLVVSRFQHVRKDDDVERTGRFVTGEQGIERCRSRHHLDRVPADVSVRDGPQVDIKAQGRECFGEEQIWGDDQYATRPGSPSHRTDELLDERDRAFQTVEDSVCNLERL